LNNGIRLNSFDYGINNTLRNNITNSTETVSAYKALFDAQFDIIFGNDVSLSDDSFSGTLRGIPFKNIIDRLNFVYCVFEQGGSQTGSSLVSNGMKFCYDLSIFENHINDTDKTIPFYVKKTESRAVDNDVKSILTNLQEQNVCFEDLFNNYISSYSQRNSFADIKRVLFMEVDFYILIVTQVGSEYTDCKLYNLFEYLKKCVENPKTESTEDTFIQFETDMSNTDNTTELFNNDKYYYKLNYPHQEMFDGDIQSSIISKMEDLYSLYSTNTITSVKYWLPFVSPDRFSTYVYDVYHKLNNDGEKFAYYPNVVEYYYCNLISRLTGYLLTGNTLLSSDLHLAGPNVMNIESTWARYVLFHYKYDDIELTGGIRQYFAFYTFYNDNYSSQKNNYNVYIDNKFKYEDIKYLTEGNLLYDLKNDADKVIVFTNECNYFKIYSDYEILDDDISIQKNKNAYDEIQNMLYLLKTGTWCFKNKLFSADDDTSGLVIFKSNIKDNPNNFIKKPDYYLYSRLGNYTINYNYIKDDEDVGDGGYSQISFYDSEESQTDKLFVLWDASTARRLLYSHYVRSYYKFVVPTDTLGYPAYLSASEEEEKLLGNLYVNFEDDLGIVYIIEHNDLSAATLKLLSNKYTSINTYFKTTIKHLLNMLPLSYNTEIIDTNFYKILRTAAIQLAETKYGLQKVKRGMWLNALDDDKIEQCDDDLLYDNFGCMIDLPKKAKWTYDQYRAMISAVYEVLIKGPSKESMQNAIKKFTGYENYLYELYKNDEYIFSNLTVDKQFRFAVQILKDLDSYDDSAEMMENVKFLLDMIKPAHTLYLIYVGLTANEIVDATNQFTDTEFFENEFNFREATFGSDVEYTFQLFPSENTLSRLLLNADYWKLKNGWDSTYNGTTQYMWLQYVQEKLNEKKAPYRRLAVNQSKIDSIFAQDMYGDLKETFTDIKKNIYNTVKDEAQTVIEPKDNREYYSLQYETEDYFSGSEKDNNLNEYETHLKIVTDENGFKKYVDLVPERDKMSEIASITNEEILKMDLTMYGKTNIKRINVEGNKFIYFENNEFVDLSDKDALTVYQNGVLVTYNAFDFIKLNDKYAYGIVLNKNLITYENSDTFSILYTPLGKYNTLNDKEMKEEFNQATIFMRLEDATITDPFKLASNNIGYKTEEMIEKLCYGKLIGDKDNFRTANNIGYTMLGTLRTKLNSIMTIDMESRNNKPFTDEELEWINMMNKYQELKVVVNE
jgi:hypothetical protein